MSQGLSVIIVNYNGMSFLKESVLSFKHFMQKHHVEHEFLIIDNASTDGSVEIIKDLCVVDDNIRPIFSLINNGFSKANNILIHQARYSTLVLLNNDTLSVDLNQLCTMAVQSIIDKNTVYTCSILNADLSQQKNTFNYPRLFNVFIDLFLIKKPLLRLYRKLSKKTVVIKQGYFSGCYLVMNRELFIEAGAFDESFFFYHEECDLFLRLEALGIQKMVLNDKIIHYGSGGSGISDTSFKNYYVNLARLLIKNAYGLPRTILSLFCLGFKFRIFLLRLGIRIAYSPFSNTYTSKKNINETSKKHLIALHKEVLCLIKNLDAR